MQQMFYRLRENWLQTILFIMLFSVATIYLLKPFYDNDFFWHLKTGEWIWNNGRLPSSDMFNFTTPATVTTSIKFTLTSYWLSQLVLYASFLANGMSGIVVVRFLVTAILIHTMLRRQQGDKVIYLSLMVLFTVLMLNFYFLERPQTASFIFFGLLLAVLERVRNESAIDDNDNRGNRVSSTCRQTIFLSLVMLLWSNAHGGHLIGQVTILIFIVTEGIKFLHPRLNPMTYQNYRRLIIVGIAGILCSLINPNNWQALLLTLQSRAGDSGLQIQEYASMLEFYSLSHAFVVILYLVVIALSALLFLAFPGKADLTEIIFLSFLGYYAFMHVRYAGFFPIAALPLLGKRLSDNPVMVRWGRRILPPVVICIALFAVSGEFSTNIATAREGSWINGRRFPEKAADFIIASELQGKMFNQYDWGGYLIWRLAPERKVFGDGRNLNSDILPLSTIICSAQVNYSTGEKIWKSILQKYDVNYILIYSRTTDGEVTPLASALLSDREWAPVFSHRGSNSIIFVRNSPGNSHVIAQSRFEGV